jgi:WD40 repeat protein
MSGARENPYVGPRSIRAGEPMYGRDREVSQLFNLLLAQRIVLLYSPSGAGKSSLLAAGLIPRLREEGFRIRPTVRVGMEPPSWAPAGVNRHVLSALLSLEEDARDGDFDLSGLAGQTLASYLERAATDEPDAAEVLVLDQFEEILTTGPADIAAKQAFFAQLGAALRDERLWLVVSMREDFIAGLDPYHGALPTGLRTTFRLDLLGKDAALAAIKGPAAAAGVAFLDVAAEELVNDLREVRVPQADGSVATQPGPHVEPVQLQVVCRSLWQQLRPEDREIGLENLARLGDVDAALATYYDAEVEAAAGRCGLPERVLRQWIGRHLVTANGLRAQVLQTPGRTLELDNAALGALVDAHLLRTDTRRGMTWVELAHDRIIKPLQESNARWFLAKLSPVQRQAELWDSRGRPERLLLATAEEAERLLAAPEARPDTEREFLEQSSQVRRREATAARTYLKLRVLTVVIVVLVVSWLSVGYVMLKRRAIEDLALANERTRLAQVQQAAAEAEQAAAEAELTRQLVAQVALHRDQQPELAALLGVAASSRLEGSWQRKAALINIGVTAPHLVARVALDPPGGTARTRRPAASHSWKVAGGGGELFAADRGGQIWRIGLGERRGVSILPPGTRAVDFAVSSKDSLLAIGGRGGTITLWDHAAGAVRAVIELPETGVRAEDAWVEGLAFSADGGSLLAVQRGSQGPSVGFVVDLAARTAKEFGVLAELRDPSALALSADGAVVVLPAGTDDGTMVVFSGAAFTRSVVRLRCVGACPLQLARFSPDGSRLLTAGEGRIALWEVESGRVGAPLRVVPLGAGEAVRDALFMRDGKLAVLSDRRISLWSGATLEPWGTPIELQARMQALGEAGAQGELIAAASEGDAPIYIFDPRRLAPRGATPVPASEGEDVFVHGPVLAALDPSGATLATTDFQPTGGVEDGRERGHALVSLHEALGAGPGEGLPPLPGPPLAAMRFTDGGARLVVADVGGEISAWSVAARAWTTLGRLPAGGDDISLGADERGRILAAVAAPEGLLLGMEADGFTVIRRLDGVQANAVTFDGAGRRVAFARCTEATKPGRCSRSVIDIHDVATFTGPPTQQIEVGFEPERMVFAANGARLACSDGPRIRVWNLEDGSPISMTVRHDLGYFNGLDMSADGALLVGSAVAHNAAVEIVLWQLDTGEELAPPLHVHNPAIGGTLAGQVLISADGERLVSSTCDGAVVWDIADDTLRRRACALAGRTLTRAEEERFLGAHRTDQALCPGEP